MGDGTFLLVIKVLASLSALYMCVSPSTSLYRMHKQRDTGHASIVPLVALWACDHMWMLYGYVTDNAFPLMVTYAVGDVLNIGFIAVYFKHSKQRKVVLKATAVALLCNAVVTIYAVLGKRQLLDQSLHGVTQTVGFIAVASSLLLYASPFSAISQVVRTKSSASIPITMCLVGIVNNALWVIYGVLISDSVLIVPTCINIVLGCIQAVLFFVYHPSRRNSTEVAATAGSDATVLPTTASTTAKREFPFSAMVTPKEGDLTSSAVSFQSEVELSKITLEAPNYEPTRPAMLAPPPILIEQ